MSLTLTRHLIAGLFSMGVLVACGGGGSSDERPIDDPPSGQTPPPPAPPVETPGGAECSVSAQNAWVYDSLQDFYLFYDEVPQLDPDTFDSPEAVLEAGRFLERDPFSFLTDVGGNSLAFDEGRDFGLGFEARFDDQRRVFASLVQPQSPLGLAGLERGDRIVDIDGRDPAETLRDRTYVSENLVGVPERPGRSLWTIEPRNGGASRQIEVVAAEFAIQTVPYTAVLSNAAFDGVVGYLVFTSFLGTSEDELDAVFADFAARGVTELVLDLRYNRGGFIRVAASLASRIAGNALAGERLYDYQFNDKYRQKDFTLAFAPVTDSLDLSRVIVLTTPSTASSSEIVASGLAPYIEVVTVGSRTAGKPYVQSANDRCGARLFAVEAEGVNADRVSVFGGIEPTCSAQDDLSADFGLNPVPGTDGFRAEGMLNAALGFLTRGACASAPAASATARRASAATTLAYPAQPRPYAIR